MLEQILVIDNEPKWTEFCQGCGLEVAESVNCANQERHSVVVISSRMLNFVPALSTKFLVVVATGEPATRESIKAFRYGAIEYIAKSFDKEHLINKLKTVVDMSCLIIRKP